MNELIFAICLVFFVAALCHAQALLTRPELFFAVTVTSEFRQSDAGRRILLRYAALGWLGTCAVFALLLGDFTKGHVAVLLAICVWLAAFLAARKWTEPHASKPTTVRQVSLSASDHKIPAGTLPLTVGPMIIVAAKALWVHLHWDAIPGRIPVHWGMNGPDRWVDRTPLAVYGFIGTIAVAVLLMSICAYGTLHASRKIAVDGQSAAAERKFKTASFAGLMMLAYVMAIVAPPIEGAIPSVPFAPVIILVTSVGIVVALMYYGQGGTRLLHSHQDLRESPMGDHTADDHWKFGMFYYDPNDPAFFVEKRFGIGWTWNFGHRLSWVAISLVLLTIFLPLFIR